MTKPLFAAAPQSMPNRRAATRKRIGAIRGSGPFSATRLASRRTWSQSARVPVEAHQQRIGCKGLSSKGRGARRQVAVRGGRSRCEEAGRGPSTKKPLCRVNDKGVFKNPAIPTFTLVCTIIGSKSLTSVFGMGTGRTFPIWSPERHADGYFAVSAPCCLVVD